MLATAWSTTLLGLETHLVRVEVEAARNVPSFELVGLAEAAVRESRVRVRSALAQLGVDLSECRVVVNMAPADLRKVGSGFDLAIACATLAALRKIPEESLAGIVFLGELALSGKIHVLRGVLPQLMGAREAGMRKAIVPHANEGEAAHVTGVDVRVAGTLGEVLSMLKGERELPRANTCIELETLTSHEDMSDVRGQVGAKRALEVAAAGGHNVLMIGPPGSGKTMLARRLGTVLPDLNEEEALEVMALQSVAGLLTHGRGGASLPRTRPFRAPHHTSSEGALVGGGDPLRPGEVSLAHRGLLFLDELPEFRRGALEALRQPLEDGIVTVSRVAAKATFPARPLVVAAMNPCPCGHYGDPNHPCVCNVDRHRRYRARISGPILDRLDVHVVLPPVELSCLRGARQGERSEVVRARVVAARERQRQRFVSGLTHATLNGAISASDVEKVCALDAEGERLLRRSFDRLGLSARGLGKVLRVARTIADLAGSDAIRSPHVAEAIGARALDRETRDAA